MTDDHKKLEPQDLQRGNINSIAFPNKPAEWVRSPAVFGEGTLQIMNHPVMEDWEKPYMQELAKIATTRGGTILELGFGMGISASYIQENDIERHIIIEPNIDVFTRLLDFSSNAVNKVIPMFGFWQDVVPLIADESVDGILFDTYPLNENEMDELCLPFFSHAHRLLKTGGIFTYFSNEVDRFNPLHQKELAALGFTKTEFKLCSVKPPKECLYWQNSTIMAPIVVK